MAGFDPSTAQPVAASGFDPSTATASFDPSTAAPAAAAPPPVHPNSGGLIGGLIDYMDNTIKGPVGQYIGKEISSDVAPFANAAQHSQTQLQRGPSLNPLDWAKDTLQSGEDLFGIATSPVNAAINAVTHPPAEAISRSGVPIYHPTVGLNHGMPTYNPGQPLAQPQAEQQVQGALGTAAMGIGAEGAHAATILDAVSAAKKSADIDASLSGTGAPVAPYVKGLFETRGMDTKPQADPRPSQIQPMTTDHMPMNAADHASYQQLLQTGSVDDIKNFFQGRQGPQPSWSDVNTWVEHRDSPQPQAVNGQPAGPNPEMQPDFNYAQSHNDYAEQQYADQNRQAVQDHIDNQTAGWSNKPDIEVVHSPNEIADPAIRAQALQDDPDGNALGLFGADGKVRMFSGRITDPETANAVLYHEGLGHYGLAAKFGDKLNATLQSLLDRNVNQFSRDTDAWQKANPGAYDGNRLRAAEEVLAERSQKGQVPSSWQDAVSASVRQFGRKMGLKLAYNDAEVNHILAMSHDAVVNGKPSAAANGFRGATQDPNKFMFAGPKGTRPGGAEPFTPSDGVPRQEFSDQDAMLREGPRDPYTNARPLDGERLGDVLHHPELFDRYPELRDLPVTQHNSLDRSAGFYDAGDSTVGKHINISPGGGGRLGTVLHEVQHSIQDVEGYPDFKRAMDRGGTAVDGLDSDAYWNHPSEIEARATDSRKGFNDIDRKVVEPPKFMRRNALGEEQQDPAELDMVDRLKTDPRYWTDQDYRANVNELARTRFPPDGPVNKFITRSQLEPKDVASEGYDRLADDYEPTTRSWDEAMQMAKNTALDTSKLQSTRAMGNLDKRLFQYNGAAKELNDKLIVAAQKVASGQELTAAEHADQVRNIAQFHYVLGRIENDSAQVGRALNAMKAIDFSRNNLIGLQKALADADSTLGGLSDPDTMNKFLKQYQLLGNAKGGQTLVRDLSKPGWEKYALTLYRNMLLSGLGTHVKAPMDMSTGIALDLEDRLGAIPIGKIHDALQSLGLTKQGGMHGREPLGYLFGMLKAITDGSAWTDAMSALANPHAQTLRMSREAPAILPGMAGKITSMPTRLIAAQDAFFRAISTNAHLYGEGVARSLAEGGNLNWSDHLDRGVSYGQNPSDAMRKVAVERANKALLLSENPLTNFLERGKQIADRANSDFLDRALTSVVDLLTPIIRVPANSLLSRVIARSPAAFLDPETRNMFKAGGRQADIAISRAVIGTLKLGMYWAAADVTGNYLSGNKRKEAEAAGWRPNSVHENGTYESGNELAASINPVDVHNSTATMVADIHDAYKAGANQGQIGTALKLAGARTMSDMYNQLWTGDIGKATGMFSDSPSDTGAATRTIGNIVSSTVVPAAIAQGRSMTDPYQRDTTVPNSISGSIGNQIINRIPGLSNGLPARYSVYGDPLKTGTNLIGTHNWVTGGNRVPETNDPAEKELDRLNSLVTSALVTPVEHSISVDPDDSSQGDHHLSPAQFEEYQYLAGKTIVYHTQQDMDDGTWAKMSDQERVNEVRSIESDSKRAAAQAIRERYYSK